MPNERKQHMQKEEDIKDLRLFTEYSALMYTEQNFMISSIFLAMLYEKYVTAIAGVDTTIDFVLFNAVEKLIAIGGYDEDELHRLREYRNEIVHNNASKNRYQKYSKAYLNFFKRELNLNKISCFSPYERNQIFERLKAYEFLKESRINKTDFEGFLTKDFFDLYVMKEKMNALKIKLTDNDFFKKSGLKPSSINKVGGTSGYVWLPLTDAIDDPEIKFNKPTLSILSTVHSLRIYLDFGGQAKDARKQYFDLYQDISFLKMLSKSCEDSQFHLFDIEWYFNIIEQYKVSSEEDSVFQRHLKNIDKYKERVCKDFDEKQVITWNRMLCGYVFERSDIDRKMILESLNKMLKIYKHVSDKM